jgi:SAM-dependent methyltransferase
VADFDRSRPLDLRRFCSMSYGDTEPLTKEAVRGYWEAHPCGAKLADAERDSPEFFAEVERTRFELEPFIHDFAEFPRWAGRDVLEVGVGLGTDFVQFARAGANLVGIDLTEAAVQLVRRRLDLEGLRGEVRTGDAEALPFDDASFDLVYSWGVVHHTPDTRAALDEIRRVLKPGGEARLMLYSRRSWVAAGAWARYALARGRPFQSFSRVLASHMESPGTKAYTQRELAALLAGFGDVRYTRWVTPYDRRVGRGLADLLGPRFGWFVGIVARP